VVLSGYGIQTFPNISSASQAPPLPTNLTGGLPEASLCGIGFYSAGGYCLSCPYGAVTRNFGAKSVEECGESCLHVTLETHTRADHSEHACAQVLPLDTLQQLPRNVYSPAVVCDPIGPPVFLESSSGPRTVKFYSRACISLLFTAH
jgi:hypothetical protein